MKKFKRASLFFVFILILSSCLKQADFNQIEDFSSEPIFESSLVYFTLNQTSFFDFVNSTEVLTPLDDTNEFTVLENKFVRDNLISAELNIQMNNQFDRRFIVNITFLDENNVETYTFTPLIVDENNQDFMHKETISISGNTQFLSSTKIIISIELTPSSDGSVLDPSIEQKLEFKSSGTFYLKI